VYETARARSRAVNRPFKWIVGVSLGIHVGVFGAVVFAQSRQPKVKVHDAIPVELVRLGKPRDPALLPRIAKSAPPPPADDAVALDTGQKKDKPERKPDKKKEPELSDAARRMLEGPVDDRLEKTLAKVEEMEGAADGVAHGTTTDPNRAARGYEAQVAVSLKQAYQLPEMLKSQQQFLSAEFVLYIEANGRISKYEIVKGHPNDLFMSALESLLKTHQLPAPPSALASQYRERGVLVRFKP
jgi:hypothetical protein